MQNTTKFFSTAWLDGPSLWLTLRCVFSSATWGVVAWIAFVLQFLVDFEVHFCTVKRAIFQKRLGAFSWRKKAWSERKNGMFLFSYSKRRGLELYWSNLIFLTYWRNSAPIKQYIKPPGTTWNTAKESGARETQEVIQLREFSQTKQTGKLHIFNKKYKWVNALKIHIIVKIFHI